MAGSTDPSRPRGDGQATVAGIGARLDAFRARVDRACDESRHLCERASAEGVRARALRMLASERAGSWRNWHRLWRRVTLRERPLVRVCMYCSRVYMALPLAHDVDEADGAWGAVPPWVRDHFGSPALRVILSHGMCPSCAHRHWDDV